MAVKRDKKKMTFDELERHVINWAVEQISEIQDYSFEIDDDVSIVEDKKFLILCELAKSVDQLLCLINPLRHDSACLVEWAFNFVDQYNKSNVPDRTPN